MNDTTLALLCALVQTNPMNDISSVIAIGLQVVCNPAPIMVYMYIKSIIMVHSWCVYTMCVVWDTVNILLCPVTCEIIKSPILYNNVYMHK